MSKTIISNTLKIDLTTLVSNFTGIKKFIGDNVELSGTVKANAYGLGIEDVVNSLSLAGCNKFFVFSLNEALLVRINTMTDEVFVAAGIFEGQEAIFLNNNITPLLNTVHQIELWINFAMKKGTKLPAIIQIDTGMSRMGINYREAVSYFEKNIERINSKLEIKYILSHLACAEDSEHEMNGIQLKLLQDFKVKYPHFKYSLCNSAGIFLGKEYHFDMVRPGAALYGFTPNFLPVHFIKEISEYYTSIAQIRVVENDAIVGYGATRSVQKGTKLAVITAGYADGYLRNLSNIGHCFIGDYKAPIIGTISMDSTIIDVTSVPEELLFEGAQVELLGPNCTIETISKLTGACGWEILTSLGNGKRYNRVVV